MSDQAPGTQDTPDDAGTQQNAGTDQQQGQTTPATPDVDWQQRYEHLQPEFTRATQEVSQYRQLVDALQADDLDTRRQAAAMLGIELVDDDDDGLEDDPLSPLAQRLDRLEQHLATSHEQQQLQAAQDQDITYLDTAFGQIERELGRELTEHEVRLLTGAALVQRDEHGRPNVQAAWQLAQQIEQDHQKRWATTKRAPHVSAAGQQGAQAPNLDDRDERQQYMLERYQSGRQQ